MMTQTQSTAGMTAHSGAKGGRIHDVAVAGDVLVTTDEEGANESQGADREPMV